MQAIERSTIATPQDKRWERYHRLARGSIQRDTLRRLLAGERVGDHGYWRNGVRVYPCGQLTRSFDYLMLRLRLAGFAVLIEKHGSTKRVNWEWSLRTGHVPGVEPLPIGVHTNAE